MHFWEWEGFKLNENLGLFSERYAVCRYAGICAYTCMQIKLDSAVVTLNTVSGGGTVCALKGRERL